MFLPVLVIVSLVAISVGIIALFSFITHKKRGLSYDADYVRKMLPGVDCGVCGEKNCVEFAKLVAEGKREPGECSLIKPENTQKIKKFFKPTYKQHTKKVAFVRCLSKRSSSLALGSKSISSHEPKFSPKNSS